SGQLFGDSNGNGSRDSGEPALVGWTVFLDNNSNGVPDSGEPQTATDASGAYAFSNLGPGTYHVREVVQPGYAQGVAARDVSVQSGVVSGGVDFANLRLASISGLVFQDNNGDGGRQAGEPGRAGVSVFLDSNSNGVLDSGEPVVKTDATGAFTFSNLGASPYQLRAVAPVGWLQTPA